MCVRTAEIQKLMSEIVPRKPQREQGNGSGQGLVSESGGRLSKSNRQITLSSWSPACRCGRLLQTISSLSEWCRERSRQGFLEAPEKQYRKKKQRRSGEWPRLAALTRALADRSGELKAAMQCTNPVASYNGTRKRELLFLQTRRSYRTKLCTDAYILSLPDVSNAC